MPTWSPKSYPFYCNFFKKTSFLLQFFGEKYAVFRANSAKMCHVMNKIMTHLAETFQELSSSNTLSAQKHTLSIASQIASPGREPSPCGAHVGHTCPGPWSPRKSLQGIKSLLGPIWDLHGPAHMVPMRDLTGPAHMEPMQDLTGPAHTKPVGDLTGPARTELTPCDCLATFFA